MMNKRNIHFLAAGVVIGVSSTPAAAVRVATYAGTISYGTDVTGVFGNVGQDLAGLSYSTNYTYDQRFGSFSYATMTEAGSYGGEYYGNSSPIIRATITINGTSKGMFSRYFGSVGVIEGVYVSHSAVDYGKPGEKVLIENSMQNFGYASAAPNSLEKNVDPSSAYDPGSSLSWFNYMSYTYDRENDVTSYRLVSRALAHFSEYSTFSISGTVPEPASWAMLIAGFGFTGASLRRKRTMQSA